MVQVDPVVDVAVVEVTKASDLDLEAIGEKVPEEVRCDAKLFPVESIDRFAKDVRADGSFALALSDKTGVAGVALCTPHRKNEVRIRGLLVPVDDQLAQTMLSLLADLESRGFKRVWGIVNNETLRDALGEVPGISVYRNVVSWDA